jgi:tRNA threonylcarbamoyladenosine biosynthesis protein TsaB
MKLLVIDTATEACSVALKTEEGVYTRYEIAPQQHSQKILPMVQSVLADANMKLHDLDGLGFGHGPGSFTGVRIATGMVQGLSLGTGLRVVGVSTLAAMAQKVFTQTDCQRVAVAIDARMKEVYFGQFINDQGIAKLVGTESVLSAENVLEVLDDNTQAYAGTGWSAYPLLAEHLGDFEVTVTYPAARHMLPLAELAFANKEDTSAEDVQPVYVRDTVTWKKLPGRE